MLTKEYEKNEITSGRADSWLSGGGARWGIDCKRANDLDCGESRSRNI